MGTDPELPVTNKAGQFVSAKAWVPGSKHEPYRVNKGAVQVDGIAAEFNTDPATTEDNFVSNHNEVIAQLKAMVAPNNLVIVPKARFDRYYFDSLSEEERELGCMPDMNAYTEGENMPPHTDEPFRTFGGHIHFGLVDNFPFDTKNFIQYSFSFVKQLDATLYIGSLLWDNDDERRSLYGKIGSFRFKNYGLEYRPLSNMILSKEEILRWLWKAGQHVKALTDQDVYIHEDKVVKEYIDFIMAGKILDHKSVRECMQYQYKMFDLPEMKGL